MKKLTAILLLVVITFATVAPCFAESNDDGAGIDTFLSVLDKWGGWLARLTGSYDVLGYITRFSDFARQWHEFISSGRFTPEGLWNLVLDWLGLSVIDFGEESSESYTL